MNSRNQQGWTMWSLAFSLSIIGFFAWIGLKIFPLYMDNSTIHSVLEPLAQDRTLVDESYDSISRTILKRLSINSIRWIQDKDIEFVEEDQYTQVRIDYEKRIKMVSNIDLIVTFENHVNLPNN
ncbi:DUF4845 domain-containing protein [Litoribrevibacter albus]|uniref:DUF4845 domain-containing protein n=1 Tax=Litoribrevibacter albus TaxID=1473156 RepID=A0AA37SAU2_9GAMM|nr:DUF4845 domain-containing protein [Litoribrevibacter albus]GLQ31204.1 DUF4845 domain-containing protein [Litoribrevibacter albus]